MIEPVRKVAVIGAGVSGVTTAAHLEAEGVNVTVFERASVAGGVWSVICVDFWRHSELTLPTGFLILAFPMNPPTRL